MRVSAVKNFLKPPVTSPPQPSSFRIVFGSETLRQEFVKFLKTIFYQLDDVKVLKEMDRILFDSRKTDKEIYEELVANIDQMRKRFPSLFHQLKALSVLQKGMGLQAAQLMKDFREEEFHDYLEIYFRRYLKTIQKTAQLPLDGKIYAASDMPYSGTMKEKLEAGALISSYPYQKHVPLNDSDCAHPEAQPEKTHKPLGNEVPDEGVDLIACLGGLHHIPKERVAPFVDSMHRKLRPGGVLLLRDHDVTNPSLRAIATVVHSFVNATSGTPWNAEEKEIREFQGANDWTELLKVHHFKRISPELLILPDDPTRNGMMAFIKEPQNLPELQRAARYRKDSVRPINGTKATWIEWGNVRYSKQFAEFVQTRHSYAFDYLGHLKQHWQYFTNYLKESRKDLSLKDTLFSDNFTMNVFILLSAFFECLFGYLTSLPSMVAARLKNGPNWRNATDLTDLEKYQAKVEKEYSNFIDHTPFYCFPYLSKIKGLWQTIWNSKESFWTKCTSTVSATLTTLGFLLKGTICSPIRHMYMKNGQYIEPERIAILIHDPQNQFQTGEKEIGKEKHKIQVIHETPDHHKLVLVPRYRPFTKLSQELASNPTIKLLEIGSQPRVTVDVLYKKDENTLKTKRANRLYEMEKLQDQEGKRFATYEVAVKDLADFEREVGVQRIEYVHE